VREEGGPQGKTVPKKLAPAAIVALKRALTAAYWYKNDLRSFISGTLNDPHVLSRINWSDPKRDIVSGAVDQMASDQQRYGDELLTLMFEVAKIDDFSHLERLEDGLSKARQAQEAIDALRKLLQGHDQESCLMFLTLIRARPFEWSVSRLTGLLPLIPRTISLKASGKRIQLERRTWTR
jgi:hypothetical protein